MSPDTSPDNNLRWIDLLNLGEKLIGLVTVEEQCQMIEETTSRLLGGHAALWLNESAYSLPGAEETSHFPAKPPNELMREVFQSHLPLSTRKTKAGVRAAVSIVAQEIHVGVLQIERKKGPPFVQADIDFLTRLASSIAVAFQVTRQVAIKNWRNEQLSLVRSVSTQIANVLDLDRLAQKVTQLILDTFHYYYVGIFTLQEGQDHLLFKASAQKRGRSDNKANPPSFISVRIGEGLVGQVAQNGEEILATRVAEEPRFRFIESLPETKSEVALPLKIEHRLLGVLDVQSDQEHAFHEIDMLVLRALADNIATAVEGARLYEDIRRRADQLSVVADVSRAITSILDVDDLLSEVVDLLHKRFGYPFVHVFTVHPFRRLIIYRAGSGPRSELFREQHISYEMDDPKGIIPWVARNGKTLVANDVDLEPLYRPSELPPGNTRSELAVPFVFGGEVLGLLDVQSDQAHAFAADDLFLFQALADNVAVAIRNANIYRSERWRRQAGESLRDVAGLLSSEVALDQVLDAILTELERNLPCEIATIWLLEENGPEADQPNSASLKLAAAHAANKTQVENVLRGDPVNAFLLSQAVDLEQPTIRSTQDTAGTLGRVLNLPPDYSALFAPLKTGDRKLGLLALAHHSPGRYGSEAISMTAAFASYAAVAIENNRLFSSAQEQAWVSTVMLQVAEASQTIDNLDELLSTMVRLTPMLVGVKSCAILLWTTSSPISLAANYGLDTDIDSFLSNKNNRAEWFGIIQQIEDEKVPVFLPNGYQELGFLGQQKSDHIHTPLAMIPILTRGSTLGAFLVERRNIQSAYSMGTFDDQQVAILQGIVQQTAIAIENIRLIEAKQEEAYVTAVLLQVAQAVVSSNDLDDILNAIVHILPILVGIDSCMIYLWENVAKVFRLAHVYPGSWKIPAKKLARSFSQGSFPLLDAVSKKDLAVIFPLGTDLLAPDSWDQIKIPEDFSNPIDLIAEQTNLLMGMPLSVKGEIYGVLLAQEAGPGGEFRERRIEIITGIAQQVALAIQNDRLNLEMLGRERLQREIQLAREIQETFLPSNLPSPTGWELDIRWKTARQVGGDFYDCFDLPGKQLGIVIADVADKGMPAALYMTVTRTLIRAIAQEGETPSKVLSRVNDLLLMDSQNGMFVTAIYAVVDLQTGGLVYSNAGHNLPLWVHTMNGEIESLAKGGTALGAWENNNLVDHRISMQPGDCLLLYTDGVTEAYSDKKEFYGETRLLKALKSTTIISAVMVLNIIDQSLMDFLKETPPSDDITLVALYRKPDRK